ncbi:MAG: hypothetical protein IKU16_05510 [Muribaculaceae bacterium]|nr:hypothetical protein [Muribaculaceae bacterium]
MRKYLFPALAMGLVLTSCQSDEPFAPGMGEEVQASFTISVPDAMGTRAGEVNSANGGFSNGAGQLNYTVVLLNDANKVMYSETCQSDVNTATFHPTVVQGYTYKVVAYATFGDAVAESAINDAFDGNDALASIAILKGISDESEDAYYCFDTEVMGGAEMSATLRRPFGKLRLVATDYDKLQALGTDVASVKVTYGDNVVMETHFNAMAEVFGGQATSKEFEANKATYAEATNELTVFTDYLPASKTGETMYPFTIVTTYTNGETYTRTFAQDIPVKRNYLTTLRGDFFTTEAALTLTVDEMFANEETINFVSVSNASQLQEAINNATPGETTEIVLNNDIAVTETLVFGAAPSANPAPAVRSEEATARTFVLDLNGKTITGTMPKTDGHVIEIRSGATLKVIGGTISSIGANGGSAICNYGTLVVEGTEVIGASIRENDGWPSYPINNYGDMTLTGVNITGYQGAVACGAAGTSTLNNCTINKEYLNTSSHVFYIYHADAKVVVNSGTYTHKGMDGSLAYVNKGEITVNGGKFSVSGGGYGIAALTNGKVTINGGEFNAGLQDWGGKIAISGGVFKTEPQAKWIADGYKSIEEDGWHVVVPEDFNGNICVSEITNPDGVKYEGDAFESGSMNNALWFNNYLFGGNAAIKVVDKTYGAIIIENCEGNFKNDVITIDNTNNSVMILQNLDFTLAEGKKLIKSVNNIYQVFMANITINGQKMTNETIGQYLENVEWYQVVEEI